MHSTHVELLNGHALLSKLTALTTLLHVLLLF